jgi:pyruvate dehydrogenase E1 component
MWMLRRDGREELLRCWGREKVIAVDYVRAFHDLIRAFAPTGYMVLGADALSRSDTRANVLLFFKMSRDHSAYAAIASLKESTMTGKDIARAIKQYKINVEKVNPDGERSAHGSNTKGGQRLPSFWGKTEGML